VKGVLEQVGQSVTAAEARLWEVDPRGEPQLRGIWQTPGSGTDAGASPSATPSPAVASALDTGQLALPDGEATASEGRWLAIPVINGTQVVGVIEVAGPRLESLDDILLVRLSAIGGYLGHYLSRRRIEADFARSLEELYRLDADRRRLLRLLVDAHEAERRALAADIHDDPLQVMAAVALRLHTLRRRLDDEPARRSLAAIEEMVAGAVSRLRSLMFNLRPTGLDHGDLIGPLRDRLEQVCHGELIEYELTGSEPATLTGDARVTLYRVAQEAISNIVKHASARHIAVAVMEQDGGCLLRVADDGSGPGEALEGRPGHLGLPTMRERSQLAGGWLRVEAGDPAGTVVTAWVPLPAGAGGAAMWAP
jgi:signal transduction histidine kinase